MPRDVAELKAQFESSDNEGKINLFKEVTNEIIIEFQNEQLIGANILEILEIFQSINEESSAMIEISENARDALLEIQHTNNELYTNQIEPINVFLDFLRPYQYPNDDEEDLMFYMEEDDKSLSDDKKEQDDSTEENLYGISAPIAIPGAADSMHHQENRTTATLSSSYIQSDTLSEIIFLSRSILPRKISGSPESYGGLNGKISYSYRDWNNHDKGPFDDDFGSGDGIM